jgi:hypothetical protein
MRVLLSLYVNSPIYFAPQFDPLNAHDKLEISAVVLTEETKLQWRA